MQKTDDAIAVVIQDWLRQRGYQTTADGEAVVHLAWLVSVLDKLAEGDQLNDVPPGLWSTGWQKGWAAALRTLRAELPLPDDLGR